MLDLAFIRDHPEEIRRGAELKGIPCDLDRLLELDQERRRLLVRGEEARAAQNALGREMVRLQPPEREEALERLRQLKEAIRSCEGALAPLQSEIMRLLLEVPNPPDPEVPGGRGEEANVEVRRAGRLPEFDFEPQDHVALLQAHKMVDLERAGRLAGSRSYVLRGQGALLEQAILRLGLDLIVARGFVPLGAPVLVKEWTLRGTAYFPGAEEQTYRIANPTSEDEDYWLSGTSEVAVTALHGGEILDRDQLPLRYAGLGPCFRREAGTYGKDTRGLYRVHQFNKVEQVVIDVADAARSRAHHEDMVRNAEALLNALEIPYRVLAACAGELGRGASFKYEIEAWMPGRGGWGETHTASRFGDFQARRLDLRYRDVEGQVRHCHTLNNTVVATPRILIPLVEVHQQADGSIRLPEALRPYLGGRDRLEA